METRRPTVMMFTGLGSEYCQMGRELFEQNKIFRASMLRLDETSRPFAGHSVLDSLYRESRGIGEHLPPLDASLALYMVELSTARTLQALGVEPACTLAASLGFFAAATVAGCLEPEDAIAALVEQAKALRTQCRKG